MFFFSVLAGLGVTLGWGIADLAGKKVVGANGAYGAILGIQIAATALICAIWFIFRLPMQTSTSAFWLILAGSSLLAVSWFLVYRAFEVGNVSVLCALYALYAIIPFVWQVAVEHLQVNIVQLIGIVLLFVAGVLVSVDFRTLKTGLKSSLSKGIVEIMGAVLMSGTAFIFMNMAVQDIGWRASYFYQQTLSLPEVLIILILMGKLRSSRRPVSWGWFSAVVLANVVAFVSFNVGMETGYVSIVGIVGTFSVAVTAFLARIFLRERLASNQYFGIALGIAGIIGLSV